MKNSLYISRMPIKYALLFALASILSGLIGLCTLGKIGSNFTLLVTRAHMKDHFKKLKQNACTTSKSM